MILKGHIGIKYHSQYINVIRLQSQGHSATTLANGGNWGRIVRALKTIKVLDLFAL